MNSGPVEVDPTVCGAIVALPLMIVEVDVLGLVVALFHGGEVAGELGLRVPLQLQADLGRRGGWGRPGRRRGCAAEAAEAEAGDVAALPAALTPALSRALAPDVAAARPLDAAAARPPEVAAVVPAAVGLVDGLLPEHAASRRQAVTTTATVSPDSTHSRDSSAGHDRVWRADPRRSSVCLGPSHGGEALDHYDHKVQEDAGPDRRRPRRSGQVSAALEICGLVTFREPTREGWGRSHARQSYLGLLEAHSRSQGTETRRVRARMDVE